VRHTAGRNRSAGRTRAQPQGVFAAPLDGGDIGIMAQTFLFSRARPSGTRAIHDLADDCFSNYDEHHEYHSYMTRARLRQLRAFAVLARTAACTQTARELHITQSGISHSMRRLDGETGCRLLIMAGQQKLPSPSAGEQTSAARAQESSPRWIPPARFAQDSSASGVADVRLEASNTASSTHPAGSAPSSKRASQISRITVESPGDTPRLIASLLALPDRSGTPLDANGTAPGVHPLFTDELRFLVSALHPWAQAGASCARRYRAKVTILYSKRSVTFRLINGVSSTTRNGAEHGDRSRQHGGYQELVSWVWG